MASPEALQMALKYGPQTSNEVRRSKYLEDALAQLQESGQHITGGWGELASKLAASYLLQKQQGKSDARLVNALRADRSSESDATMARLRGGSPSQGAAQSPAPAQPSPEGAPPAPTVANFSPPGRVESRPLGPPPAPSKLEAALAGVLPAAPPPAPGNGLSRLISALGGAVPGAKITSGLRTEADQERLRRTGYHPARNSHHLAGEALDFVPPPGMSPDQVRSALSQTGLPMTEFLPEKDHIHWASAGGRGGPPPGPPMGGPAPMQYGQMQAPQGPVPGPQMQAQAPRGPMPPPPASAPNGGPGPLNAPSAMMQPQAGAQPQANALAATPGEIDMIGRLLSDPQTHELGMQKALEIEARANAPVKYQNMNVNGLPMQFNPYDPSHPSAIPVPKEAQTQIMGADQLGFQAPRGTVFQRDPLGNVKQAWAPPENYAVTQDGGGFAPVRGSARDPNAPQPPAPGFQNGPGGQQYIRGSQADPSTGANLVTNERQLREEYNSTPSMVAYNAARAGYEKVVRAANDSTGASDIALIFGFMKTLDPGSTVREGEFATAQNSGSVPQTVLNLYEKARHGERLQPEQRQAFATTAGQQFQTYQEQAARMNERYGQMAQSYGFSPDRIVQQLAPVAPPAGTPHGGANGPAIAVSPGTRAAAIEQARKRGLLK